MPPTPGLPALPPAPLHCWLALLQPFLPPHLVASTQQPGDAIRIQARSCPLAHQTLQRCPLTGSTSQYLRGGRTACVPSPSSLSSTHRCLAAPNTPTSYACLPLPKFPQGTGQAGQASPRPVSTWHPKYSLFYLRIGSGTLGVITYLL